MNLKTITLILLTLGMSINAGYGMFVPVSIGNSNGCPVYAINDRPVTRSSLTNLLGKLGSLDKDTGIYLCVDKQVSALSLVSAISDIQDAGLHTIILICPAVENGKTGAYQLSIDATKQLMSRGCCGGDGIESGFHESSSCSELVEVMLKKDNSQDVRIQDKKVDLPSGSTMPVMAAVPPAKSVQPEKTYSITVHKGSLQILGQYYGEMVGKKVHVPKDETAAINLDYDELPLEEAKAAISHAIGKVGYAFHDEADGSISIIQCIPANNGK